MTRATLRSVGADEGVVGRTWTPRGSCCPRLLLCVLPGTESPRRRHTVIKFLLQAVARDIRLLLDMTNPRSTSTAPNSPSRALGPGAGFTTTPHVEAEERE